MSQAAIDCSSALAALGFFCTALPGAAERFAMGDAATCTGDRCGGMDVKGACADGRRCALNGAARAGDRCNAACGDTGSGDGLWPKLKLSGELEEPGACGTVGS